MSDPLKTSRKPGPKPRPKLTDKDVTGLKLFKPILTLLEKLHTHKDCPNRKLHYDQYASLFLLYFLNPTLTSLRSLQQASGLRNVQKKLGLKRTSLGSLSEASHVFDPALLAKIVQELAGRAQAEDAMERPPGVAEELEILAVDGSLLRALPRMLWAKWLDADHCAAKLHLQFDVIKGIPKSARVTEGNGNEKKALEADLEPDKLYLEDRGYVGYAHFNAIRQAGSSFVCRVKESIVVDEIVTERALSEADLKARVIFDRVVRLGGGKLTAPVRLIKIHVECPVQCGPWRPRSRMARKKPRKYAPKAYDIVLVTDRMDLSAEAVAMLFRYRWTIELFFRWFKCILGFSHLLCESRAGVEILVYCALIVSLLITLWTGRKPTKRTLEMIQLYFQGWAEWDEVLAHITGLKKISA